MPLCGGTSDAKPADAEIQSICDKVKGHAQEKLSTNFQEFKAISYKTQVVAGTNYFIKVGTGGKEAVHLRVFKPLPCNGTELQLHSALGSQTHESALEYF